jgi:hypothetical protein
MRLEARLTFHLLCAGLRGSCAREKLLRDRPPANGAVSEDGSILQLMGRISVYVPLSYRLPNNAEERICA